MNDIRRIVTHTAVRISLTAGTLIAVAATVGAPVKWR
jgi:hypothetical protein